MPILALTVLLQIAVPPPRGYVNDFAGVLDAASVAHMEAVIAEVREKTRGEIAVVTLSDIDDRSAADVALQIGRQWGVGAKGEAGDPTKNLGVVVLLVPQKNHRPGTGQIFIATGRGAEGFLPDARVGRIRDAMTPYLAREEYGPGLAYGVDLIAQALAQEFGVTLSAAPPAPRPAQRDVSLPSGATLFWVIFVTVLLLSRLARRRRRWGRGIWWAGGGRGGGGWGGGRERGGGGVVGAGNPRPGPLRREHAAHLRHGGRCAVRRPGSGHARLDPRGPAGTPHPDRAGVARVGGRLPHRIRGHARRAPLARGPRSVAGNPGRAWRCAAPARARAEGQAGATASGVRRAARGPETAGAGHRRERRRILHHAALGAAPRRAADARLTCRAGTERGRPHRLRGRRTGAAGAARAGRPDPAARQR